MPAVLGQLSERKTPVAGVTVVALIMSGFIIVGDITVVARIATFSTLVSFGLVNISLVSVLKREAGGWLQAMKRPVGFLQPVLGALACTWLAIDVSWTAAIAGASLGIFGFCLGVFVESKRTGRRTIEQSSAH
jgi:amino acid transporter